MTTQIVPGSLDLAFKISLYADDTELMVSGREDFVQAAGSLHAYCQASGAKVNARKSSVIFQGPGFYLGDYNDMPSKTRLGEGIGMLENEMQASVSIWMSSRIKQQMHGNCLQGWNAAMRDV